MKNTVTILLVIAGIGILIIGFLMINGYSCPSCNTIGYGEDESDVAVCEMPGEVVDVCTEVIAKLPSTSQGSEADKIEEDELYYKTVMTTVFWVGERANKSNDYISNKESFWDSDWENSYGGLDSENDRCGYHPCDFTPKENPFYFALPYADYEDSVLKENALDIPWGLELKQGESILKNAWLEVKYKDKTCYAQWEDVGPNETDDFEYVFGESTHLKNTFGVLAGLDVSPAVRDCLGLLTNDYTDWRFLKVGDVPSGPWKEIITKSNMNN